MAPERTIQLTSGERGVNSLLLMRSEAEGLKGFEKPRGRREVHVRTSRECLTVAVLQVKHRPSRLVYARFDRDGDAPVAGRDPEEACGVAARLRNSPTNPVARLPAGARMVRDYRDAALRASRQRKERRQSSRRVQARTRWRRLLIYNQSPSCRQGKILTPVTAWRRLPGSGGTWPLDILVPPWLDPALTSRSRARPAVPPRPWAG